MKGAYSRVRLNSEISRKNMLLLALMSSENVRRTAHYYPAGGYNAFIKAMNAKAKGMSIPALLSFNGLLIHNVSTAI